MEETCCPGWSHVRPTNTNVLLALITLHGEEVTWGTGEVLSTSICEFKPHLDTDQSCSLQSWGELTPNPPNKTNRLKESDFILNVHPDGRSVAPKHMRENSPEQEVLVSENDLRCSTDITKTTTGARRPHWAFHHKKRCVQELLYHFSDWKNVIKYFQTS